MNCFKYWGPLKHLNFFFIPSCLWKLLYKQSCTQITRQANIDTQNEALIIAELYWKVLKPKKKPELGKKMQSGSLVVQQTNAQTLEMKQ